MNSLRIAGALLAALTLGSADAQTVSVRPAPSLQFPAPVDSNSPGHWWNQQFVLFNSEGSPDRSSGTSQFALGQPAPPALGQNPPYPLWIEATFMDADGTLFAWYHHEPQGLCPDTGLTAPVIGEMVSYDNGLSFHDVGLVIQSGDPIDCTAQNGYFAGGNGDFSVILDNSRNYFYFLFTNYGGDPGSQGISVARMPYWDRFQPVGNVQKFYQGDFTEPGLGGRVSPIFPVNNSWMSSAPDGFWGPSVHYNTTLGQYVMLLNRACCTEYWPPDGIYASMIPDLSVPLAWSAPTKILDGDGVLWYPQVIGEGDGETDKVAGAVSRLYVFGVSNWELVATPAPPDPSTVSESAPSPDINYTFHHITAPTGDPK